MEKDRQKALVLHNLEIPKYRTMRGPLALFYVNKIGPLQYLIPAYERTFYLAGRNDEDIPPFLQATIVGQTTIIPRGPGEEQIIRLKEVLLTQNIPYVDIAGLHLKESKSLYPLLTGFAKQLFFDGKGLRRFQTPEEQDRLESRLIEQMRTMYPEDDERTIEARLFAPITVNLLQQYILPR